jgi:hypothetical protein
VNVTLYVVYVCVCVAVLRAIRVAEHAASICSMQQEIDIPQNLVMVVSSPQYVMATWWSPDPSLTDCV